MTAPLRAPAAPVAPAAPAAPAVTPLGTEVLRGLRGDPKTLPPKLFYDAAGAELFERISELPEYYLTRTELTILRAHVDEIATLVGPRAALIEYGSGAGVKVRLLLDALIEPAAYVPIDISREQLARVATELSAEYPRVAVRPLAADYTAPLQLPPLPPRDRRVAFFPGSTIGNFHPPEAAAFLRRVRRTLGANGLLVLGVDRRKDAAALHAAYNDAAGVTAAFNLNLLARLNRELGADFELDALPAPRVLQRRARAGSRCTSSARSRRTFTSPARRSHFDAGESIWTESSYKYDAERLDALAAAAGFRVVRRWTDAAERFWVVALEVAER